MNKALFVALFAFFAVAFTADAGGTSRRVSVTRVEDAGSDRLILHISEPEWGSRIFQIRYDAARMRGVVSEREHRTALAHLRADIAKNGSITLGYIGKDLSRVPGTKSEYASDGLQLIDGVVYAWPILSTSSAADAGVKTPEWIAPVMRRAVLWLLYDDWGQDQRAYGFDRIKENESYRPKPASLRAAKAIHLDASGWGGRRSFIYHPASTAITVADTDSKTFKPLDTIRISVQKHSTDFTTKVAWEYQLFFLKLRPTPRGVVVTEFTDHWLTLKLKDGQS